MNGRKYAGVAAVLVTIAVAAGTTALAEGPDRADPPGAALMHAQNTAPLPAARASPARAERSHAAGASPTRAERSHAVDASPAETQRSVAQDVCHVVSTGVLPAEVRESSGLARGRARPDVFWTHNDSGNEPEIFGVSESGALVARVHVEGASIVDWEDIEAAPCEAGSCLYIADTGDNEGERATVTVYELAEPKPGATRANARAWHARYPGERADAEALFVVRSELYLLTKGRHGSIRLYRVPRAPGEAAVLERIAELAPEPSNAADRVTAATTTPDGRWVVVRTQNELRFHPAERLLAGDTSGALTWDARGLGHPQGEAVAVDDAGTVWLSSEAERGGSVPLTRLECRLP